MGAADRSSSRSRPGNVTTPQRWQGFSLIYGSHGWDPAGHARTRDAAGRQGHSSGKVRDLLHAGGIKVVIPEKADAIARRQAKGSAGGRPLYFDADAYKDRNVVERYFNKLKNWAGIATRYDKLAAHPVLAFHPGGLRRGRR